jgi:hypothetical protein
MSVDDPSDDRQQTEHRPDDRRTSPTALRATDPALTIEFARESGEIRIRRETPLGTYTESVDR